MPDTTALNEDELIQPYLAHPLPKKVSRKGWEGVLRMGVIAAKTFGIEWDDKLVQLLANCVGAYETFKQEFPDVS